MDDGDLSVPPMFNCQACGGEMYPEYYKGYMVRSIDYLTLEEEIKRTGRMPGFSYYLRGDESEI
jgi:hypothetical protein